MASIQEEGDFTEFPSTFKKKQSPKINLERMLKQESKSRLLASNDHEGFRPVLKYQKFDPHKVEVPEKKKRRFQSVDRTKVEGSTFGKVGAQTLSCALKTRMIVTNNYGMEKEKTKIFRSPSK